MSEEYRRISSRQSKRNNSFQKKILYCMMRDNCSLLARFSRSVQHALLCSADVYNMSLRGGSFSRQACGCAPWPSVISVGNKEWGENSPQEEEQLIKEGARVG